MPLVVCCVVKGASAVGGSSRPIGQVQDRLDGLVSAVMVVGLPAAVYFMTHLELIFEWEHIWSVALLWSFPLVFVSAVPGAQSIDPTLVRHHLVIIWTCSTSFSSM